MIESVEKTQRIGRETRVPAIESHHKCMNRQTQDTSAVTLAMIDMARAAGQDVGLDACPWVAGSTLLFPERDKQATRVILTWSRTMPGMVSRVPRVRLGHLPTPLEPMPRLTKALGGPKIWVKRDDCTGLSTGGNKTRKLKFLMAAAVAQGADMVMTQGARPSHHPRQTAAAAARPGMACDRLLEDRTGSSDPNHTGHGNVLADHFHGATTETRPGDLDMNAELETLADTFRARGRTVCIIPGGGSNQTGALG